MAILLTKDSRVIVQGNTGAIVEGSMGTAQSKLDVLIGAGAHHAKTFMDIPEILQRLSI